MEKHGNTHEKPMKKPEVKMDRPQGVADFFAHALLLVLGGVQAIWGQVQQVLIPTLNHLFDCFFSIGMNK